MSEVVGERGGCGCSFGPGGSTGESDINLFGTRKTTRRDVIQTVQVWEK
jgi:nitrate reductase beta subunit